MDGTSPERPEDMADVAPDLESVQESLDAASPDLALPHVEGLGALSGGPGRPASVDSVVSDPVKEEKKAPKKERAFMAYARKPVPMVDPAQRISTWGELHLPVLAEHLHEQSARCMDCGVPFCQSDTGCPLDNRIPEFNELVYREKWEEASERLHSTNNFPEFTGRVCPAPCEGACVLGHVEKPVTIEDIEREIAERAFDEGWIVAEPPEEETGRSVGIIGSGPAGLAAAQQLRRRGHRVTVYERADRVGGLLTYGIPNMKLDKGVVDRRVRQLEEEGVRFWTGLEIGVDEPAAAVRSAHDALLLAVGSTRPRDLPVDGRDSGGIHFAMDYLTESTKALLDGRDSIEALHAAGKKVVVIGGGDTGTDCIATALRQKCASLTTFELMDKPPESRGRDNPWPEWPRVFRVDYGHAEARALTGKDPRAFGVLSKRFLSNDEGQVCGIETVHVRWAKDESGRYQMEEVAGSEETIEADLVLLAMGFVGPEKTLLEALELESDARGNVVADDKKFATNLQGVFAAGDCRRGQSLVVWAIAEGREAALAIDAYLHSL